MNGTYLAEGVTVMPKDCRRCNRGEIHNFGYCSFCIQRSDYEMSALRFELLAMGITPAEAERFVQWRMQDLGMTSIKENNNEVAV